jgi:hypothetical protein
MDTTTSSRRICAPRRPERNRQAPLGGAPLDRLDNEPFGNPFQQNSSARFVGPSVFSGSATALCATVSIKNDNINLPATSWTASIANAAALVEHEPRRLGVALVYLCAHEESRVAGTVKDLARRPSQQRADRLNLGRATSSLTAACRPQARASLFRKASGRIIVQPRLRARPSDGSWSEPWPPSRSPRHQGLLKPRSRAPSSFDQIDSVPTKNAEPFLQSKPARRPLSPQSRPVSPESMVAMITVEHPPDAPPPERIRSFRV